MSSTPNQNGITDKQNHTLKDMVRSMINHFSLPKNHFRRSLKTIVYILNRVPSKAVTKTPYELYIGKKPSIKHLHV